MKTVPHILVPLLALLSPIAAAEPAPPPAPAGWSELIAALNGLPQRMLARLPEAQRADPQVQQQRPLW